MGDRRCILSQITVEKIRPSRYNSEPKVRQADFQTPCLLRIVRNRAREMFFILECSKRCGLCNR